MAEVRRFAAADVPADLLTEVRALLDAAFVGDYSDDDWEHAQGGWHLVVMEQERVVAYAAVVGRILEVGDRSVRTGYVEAVATTPARQRAGLGSLVMAEVAEVVRGESEMGALSTSVDGFYEQLGWERWQGPTFVRRGTERVRTEDEDGGILVLRFGPSATLDLTAPIACDARTGDDW